MIKKRFLIEDIDWLADDCVELPHKLTIELVFDSEEDLENDEMISGVLSDMISDKWGWLLEGFNWEMID